VPGPRVDFYVLAGADARQRLRYACRLVEKAYLLDHKVFVRLDTPVEAEAVDELLWTFADRSFVPHELATAGAPPGAVVQVGTGDPPPGHADLLVNLGSDVPAGFQGFARIAELVDADEERRRQGRERFRYYREHGLSPESHTVGAAG
jgi:DNA polymerase III subunit chi